MTTKKSEGAEVLMQSYRTHKIVINGDNWCEVLHGQLIIIRRRNYVFWFISVDTY